MCILYICVGVGVGVCTSQNNKFLNILFASVSSVATQIPASQSTMMKFLNNNKYNDQKQVNTQNIFGTLTQSSNVHNTINSNSVKLLSDDNAGIDFLTLCAMKKSEQEMSTETVPKMDTIYIPVSRSTPDLFNFVVPDTKILDNLSFLNISLNKNKSTQCKNYEDDIHSDNDCVNIDDDNIWCTIRNERNINDDRIRFEDILDESSDSQRTTISHLNLEMIDLEVNSVNASKSPVLDTKADDEIMADKSKAELSSDMFDMEEPSIFENILNDSSSSIGDYLEDNDTPTRQNTLSPDSPNITTKNIEKINVLGESNFNVSHDRDVDQSNKNLSIPTEFTKSNQTNKFRSFIDDIQGFDFNTDDEMDMLESNRNKNKSTHNSKVEESMLSITQIIGEIARAKNNPESRSKPSVSKEELTDEESGWISVNISNNTKNEERNKSVGIKNKLANISYNQSTTESHTEDEILKNNSDEDFMVTEDNIKRFDELESSYFRDQSKNTSDGSNNLHSMPSNSMNESNNFCSTSKSVKPCGPSTSTDKRLGLSLKRDKNQFSNTIDLNVFKATNKYSNNKKDESVLKSTINDLPKQISLSDKKFAQKTHHKYKSKSKAKNEFIDDEVQVSPGASSDESIETVDDEDLTAFVSYTQNIDSFDMQAHYLQTIKSPINRPGAFHFKKPRSPEPDIEIYSQPLSQIQNSYLYVRNVEYIIVIYINFLMCINNLLDFYFNFLIL